MESHGSLNLPCRIYICGFCPVGDFDDLCPFYTRMGMNFLVVNYRVYGQSTGIGFTKEKGFKNLEKIMKWDKPTLIIHVEFDHIIPLADGQALYDVYPTPDKTFLRIPGANHNDILMKGLDRYMMSVRILSEKTGREKMQYQ